MNKTIFKIFGIFVCSAAVIATILLVINFMGFAIVGTDVGDGTSPKRILSDISAGLSENNDGYYLADASVIPQGGWCILIDDNGDIIWSENKPEDIPSHYSLSDVARMTRWFLNDYPIYVRIEERGLLVLGLPKNTLGKYQIEYSMQWFETLPERIFGVLLLNICLAALMAVVFGLNLYRNLRRLMRGISDLRHEKKVKLREKGIFKEVFGNLNRASEMIERKNIALAKRDNARSVWIAGVSHDLRTPLSVVTGYSEALAECSSLSEEDRKKAEAVLANSLKMKKLIDDLNLISSMEYDMQPSKKKSVKICPLLRRVVTEIINNGLSEDFDIKLDLKEEKAVTDGDESLLERAFFNLINNAVTHNQEGCRIKIEEDIDKDNIRIVISDNGSGVDDEVLSKIGEIPKTAHGIGLPMAYRIIMVHGGSFRAYNMDGFTVEILLPLK